jgi:hypothetical protein
VPRRKATPPVPAAQYLVEILGRRFPVADMMHASELVSAVRDRSGYGASEMGAEFPVLENGRVVGYVSYNGKVWRGQPGAWPNVELVYDPYREDEPRETSARVLSGASETPEVPGLDRAVQLILKSAEKHRLTTVSGEHAYFAVVRKTSILDDARIDGDHVLMPIFIQALEEAAGARGIAITA